MRYLVVLSVLLATALAANVPAHLQRWRRVKEAPDFSSIPWAKPGLNPAAKPDPRPRATPKKQGEECGVENSCAGAANNRIIGGDEVQCAHQFPWLVTVNCANPGWLCTGSLIDPEWVLTAGHCVVGCFSYDIYLGTADRNDLDEDSLVISVDGLDGNQFQHPDYFAIGGIESLNDVALIPLPEPAPLNDAIALSCLPFGLEDEDFAGEFATATGWGKTDDDDTGGAVVLNYASDIPVISNEQCEDEYANNLGTLTLIVTPENICIATEQGSGTCNGDSGGPLNWQPNGQGAVGPGTQYVQIGVTSYGPNNGCESGKPTAYARVTSFLGWISDVTGIEG